MHPFCFRWLVDGGLLVIMAWCGGALGFFRSYSCSCCCYRRCMLATFGRVHIFGKHVSIWICKYEDPVVYTRSWSRCSYSTIILRAVSSILAHVRRSSLSFFVVFSETKRTQSSLCPISLSYQSVGPGHEVVYKPQDLDQACELHRNVEMCR